MESDRVPPDQAAFAELTQLVHHLADELASFRRRALAAESRVRQLEAARAASDAPVPPSAPADAERIALLSTENAELAARLEAATERTTRMLDRVRFLRQQHVLELEK